MNRIERLAQKVFSNRWQNKAGSNILLLLGLIASFGIAENKYMLIPAIACIALSIAIDKNKQNEQ